MAKTTIRLTIKQAIQKRGWTQKQLAEAAGIREATVSALARGYVDRIDLRTLERIADALGINDINELLTIVDEED